MELACTNKRVKTKRRRREVWRGIQQHDMLGEDLERRRDISKREKQTFDGKLVNRLEVLLVLIRFIRLAICIDILHNEAIIWRHASKLEWSEKVNVWGARARERARARAQSFIFLTEWDCNSLVSRTIMRMIEEKREREAKRRGEEKRSKKIEVETRILLLLEEAIISWHPCIVAFLPIDWSSMEDNSLLRSRFFYWDIFRFLWLDRREKDSFGLQTKTINIRTLFSPKIWAGRWWTYRTWCWRALTEIGGCAPSSAKGNKSNTKEVFVRRSTLRKASLICCSVYSLMQGNIDINIERMYAWRTIKQDVILLVVSRTSSTRLLGGLHSNARPFAYVLPNRI